ncbi:HTH-type transcriptional repressor YvoA [Andreprevotia sp. IGB-42]|uniref:GntR family transcriptional regulator n=1 Tax=Andreprevotia sp. IGB-42 TaxID=2497473 RepID=UPI00135C7836|nr:GntR family transcriptional regulator [Andreprevotia sp. IGB-42]KAF0813122.1 HTH-type transcriptional repressor YvoA [Andreprevotia sp. IGB-42]
MQSPQKLQVLRPDPDSATPLYLQLSHKLAAAIQAGFWRPEEPLPSERHFCDLLGVSRVTARKALDLLYEQGLILRRQGAGTFITPKLEQPLTRLTNLSEMLKQRGFTPGSKWLSREVVPAGNEEVARLNLAPTSHVSRLLRVRTANDTVMAVEETALPHTLVPDPLLIGDSLYEFLSVHRLAVVRALQHIAAINADERLAGLVDVPVGAAMLHLTRVGYRDNGQAVELTHSWFRSDFYDFVVELHR